MDNIERYPGFKFVGFWRMYKYEGEYNSTWEMSELQKDITYKLPWPGDLVDVVQDYRILERVALYLDNGYISARYRGWSNCRLCGEHVGSKDKSDGVYVWPDGLSHYLRIHKVRLSDEFVEHALRNQLKPFKVFLDDERLAPNGWIRAYSYYGAVDLLGGENVEEISFDHDLGHRRTGYDVLVWLEKKIADNPGFHIPEKISIHTANPVGRARMKQVISSIRRFAGDRYVKERL
jgi:hypothetical protein